MCVRVRLYWSTRKHNIIYLDTSIKDKLNKKNQLLPVLFFSFLTTATTTQKGPCLNFTKTKETCRVNVLVWLSQRFVGKFDELTLSAGLETIYPEKVLSVFFLVN